MSTISQVTSPTNQQPIKLEIIGTGAGAPLDVYCLAVVGFMRLCG